MNLKLLKFQQQDFAEYFSLVSNIDVMKQITERAIQYDEAKLKFEKIIECNEKHCELGSYKIYDGSNFKFVGLGHVTLNDENKGEAEIGYMFLPEFWGMGYGTETAKLLIEIAHRFDIHLIKAIIDPHNKPSKRILMGLGFVSQEIRIMNGLLGEILSKTI